MLDLIVVGAGPAGAAFAGAMADLGWQVLLVERASLPRHKVCGEFLSPAAQASLKALGRLELVRSLRPYPISRARLTSAAGRQIDLDLPGGDAWGLSRFALDQGLVQSASRSGVELVTKTTASEITWNGAHYRVKLRERSGQERIATARSVVGAWGRSPVGRGIPRQPADPQRSFVGVKCHLTALTPGPQVHLYLFRGGYAGLAPVEAGRTNFSGLMTPATFRAAGGTVERVLWSAAAWNPCLGNALKGARLQAESAVVVAGVQTDRQPQPWSDLPLLGDAVTMVPPLFGDGQAMALRSAELSLPLADRFLHGQISRQHWQQRHEALWHQEFGSAMRMGRLLQRLLLHPTAAEVLVILGRLAPWLPPWLAKSTRAAYRSPESVRGLTP